MNKLFTPMSAAPMDPIDPDDLENNASANASLYDVMAARLHHAIRNSIVNYKPSP